MGAVTLGLGLTLWFAANAYRDRSENHAQSLQIIKDVQGVLEDKMRPVFLEASRAMDAAAQFFDTMSVLLREVVVVGKEAAEAGSSELHVHYQEMRSVMKDLRSSVQNLSNCVSRQQRLIASAN